ncbi:MAG: hypothetical protein UU98_C0021G0017 [Parcubacteria group bacterium GW2011_GWD2_42_14]|nr:MAG: hypothetical protein UU98_C0021G0017 [Parcubacteria group bacterium GW2011_GWD2_42_14]
MATWSPLIIRVVNRVATLCEWPLFYIDENYFRGTIEIGKQFQI